jgi:hypothetical protein
MMRNMELNGGQPKSIVANMDAALAAVAKTWS